MGVIERRARQKAEVRNNILDAARKLAREKDWSAVTIRSIADAIEYTPPIVYEHFENKEDVLLTIVKDGFNDLRKAISEVIEMDLSADEKLVQVSMVHWNFAISQPEVFRLMHNPERMEQQRAIINEDLAQTKAQIEGLFQAIGVQKDETPEIFFNWFCLMMGYIGIITSLKPEQAAKRIEETLDKKMQTLFKQPGYLFERAIRRFVKSL